jgi:hypothetical protein
VDCFVDADFAGLWKHEDVQDSVSVKSCSGYLIMFMGCPLLWGSKLQTQIALSTMEAEYIALSLAMRELIALQEILKDIYVNVLVDPKGLAKINYTTVAKTFGELPQSIVHEDNEACLKFASLPKMSPRTKHIAIPYHFFCSKVEELEIKVVAINTNYQLVCILLTYAALNGLDAWAADIKSAYLQAPSLEKHYIICGPKFGPANEGCIAVITRALYGGKYAGSDYWKHMRACMTKLNFTSCQGDLDVWRRPGIKSDGTPYYTYVCLYVDDCLVIDEFPELVIRQEIGKFWMLKASSVDTPTIYLGNKVIKVTFENDMSCWAFSLSQYVQALVSNVEKHLKQMNACLPKNAHLKDGWIHNESQAVFFGSWD